MSERPTPETDMSQHEGLLRGNAMPTQVVHVNFARKLERERDEWAAMCGRYKQERDEAREQIEVCRGIIERTVIARNSALSDLTELERERDDLQKAVNGLCEHFGVNPANTTLLAVEVLKIERERDEAREKMADALQEIDLRTLDFERMKKECDEAREALASREVVLAQQKVITDLILERDRSRAVLQEIEAARWHTACELRRIATRALGSKT